MEITQVKVFPVAEDKLKAFVSITIDECFVISDIKIIQGANGLFVSMPSKKRKNGTFRDIAHPLNNETRRQLEDQIIHEYREVLSNDACSRSLPARSLVGDGSNLAGGGDGVGQRGITPRHLVGPPHRP